MGDWLLTVPLLLIEILLVMKLPDDVFSAKAKTLGLGSALMIISGYYGELVVTGDLAGFAGPSPCASSSMLCTSSWLALLLLLPRSRTQSSRARFSRPRCGLLSAGAHTQLSTCSQWLASVDAALSSTSRLATASLTSSPSAVLA